MNKNSLQQLIQQAFRDVKFPGPNRLVDSDSFEARATRSAFQECVDWRDLEVDFLDSAPDGLGSALNFFSPQAFQFFLPAYLLADLSGKLSFVEPDFSLCFMFNENWRSGRGSGLKKYSLFTDEQCQAIVEYLQLRYRRCGDPMIQKALQEYWVPRLNK